MLPTAHYEDKMTSPTTDGSKITKEPSEAWELLHLVTTKENTIKICSTGKAHSNSISVMNTLVNSKTLGIMVKESSSITTETDSKEGSMKVVLSMPPCTMLTKTSTKENGQEFVG